METKGPKDIDKYSSHYSEEGFINYIDKIKSYPQVEEILIKAFSLYYVAKEGKLDNKSKIFIFGALGYLILPIDLIPDIIPGVGLIDDLAALVAVFNQLNKHIDDEIKEKATSKVKDLLNKE